jgi:glycerol dehydrogenase
MLSVFSAPGRYVQGADATQSLGAELKNLGFDGPALIVASNSAQGLLSPTWNADLG